MEFQFEQLRKLRKAKGYSLRQLAKKLKLSPGYLSNIELGKAKPSISTLEVLAKTLGVSTSYFFNKNEEQQKQNIEFPDLETYLQKILSGEIPIHFHGVDKLTPELEDDIRAVLKVALSHIQLQKEKTIKKAEANRKGVMNLGEKTNQWKEYDEFCSLEFIHASAL